MEKQSGPSPQSSRRSRSTPLRPRRRLPFFALCLLVPGLLYAVLTGYIPLPLPPGLSGSLTGRSRGPTLDGWLEDQSALAVRRILDNLGPGVGAGEGAVIASPSRGGKDEPDYFYTWTRDSALTISTLLHLFLHPSPPKTKHGHGRARTGHSDVLYETLLRSYIASQAQLQVVQTPSGGLYDGGLNEPKFEVNLSAFTGPWGRPQRDGPALRALALIPYAHLLLDRNFPLDRPYLTDHLFSADHMRHPGVVLKNDLEEVAHGWWEGGFDLWEEVDGHHLFTLAVSMKALRQGSELASRLDDTAAADFYSAQSRAIGETLGSFWDEEKGYWLSSLPSATFRGHISPPGSEDLQKANTAYWPERQWLDCALPLTLIHAAPTAPLDNRDGDQRLSLSLTHPTVLASLHRYILSFDGLYNLNKGRRWTRGWALGRYKEDVYDGVGQSEANPWFICTFSLAHALYLAQTSFEQQGTIEIHNLSIPFWQEVLSDGDGRRLSIWESGTGSEMGHGEVWKQGGKRYRTAMNALGRVADNFVRAGRRYAADQGRMSEQIDRNTGSPRGARDLTWSYASLVEVARARKMVRY